MEVFVARQPIYTKTRDIFAYELLYRNNFENKYVETDGDMATTEVIINSFLNIGMERLSNHKPCFINFTDKLLRQKIPTYFQPNEIIVEILETVKFNSELLSICTELKRKGYKIALDDFILDLDNPYSESIIKLANIIKVDFRNTDIYMRKKIEHIASQYNIQLLAEKIETNEEFEYAVNLGYTYYQGYFFSKPIIVSTREVPEYLHNYLAVMKHLSNTEPDFNYIAQLIEQDLSLSYKLLKLANSPAFRPLQKINSIKQAVIRLGLNELKKWLYILSIRGNITNKGDWAREIFINSLTRAKMCELIAKYKAQTTNASSYFLTGMFSLMDTLLGMEMARILKLVPLQDDMSEALIGQPNEYRTALDLCISFEKGTWEKVSFYCKQMNIDENTVLHFYNQAFQWSNELLEI